MCGIIAILDPQSGVTEETLNRSLLAMGHRGPDGRRTWLAEDRSIALGHTRLSIIGLENGAQPIANESGQIHIIVNGEFYDFERIRAALKEQGHRFSTDSDAEIALHLYEEYGIDCLSHLRGEFAFVIWDNNRKRLFAARDRFGIKPLYYSQQGQRLTLASESKALFASGIKAAWDNESFFHCSQMQYVLPQRSLFAGINQLAPGQYMLADSSGCKTDFYWDMDYAPESQEPVNETDSIETFQSLLNESIRLRLRADIPVACHISGGLDSSTILGMAAKHSSKPINAFSVSFEEQSYDELSTAQAMAEHAGAIFHAVRVSQEDLIAHLEDAVYFSEGLAVNGHLSAKYLLHKEIKRAGFKVVLTGEGSDELVAGYPHLRSDHFRSSGRSHLIKQLYATNQASQGIMLKHGDSLSLEAVSNRLGYLPAFLEAKGSLGYKITSVLADDFKSSFAKRDAYADLIGSFDIEGQLKDRDHVHQSLYLWCKTALVNYILKTLGDGTELAHSVEGRVPFLDHHLFEYVRTLPVNLKIKGEIEKYVLREAARPFITDTIYRSRKHPFVAPPLSLFSNHKTNDLVQEKLRSANFATIPFFNQQKIIALLDRLPAMPEAERSAIDPVLMIALSATAIQERLIKGSAA
ncbi:MAG: asparagine synthase (glutamine-hydrolyzing) [Candidatus Obscuribacterales bacterium]|nr:asparagine synthase (glutamine-hydrolyzing) [Candidatus Obscuribacterales bacterium]